MESLSQKYDRMRTDVSELIDLYDFAEKQYPYTHLREPQMVTPLLTIAVEREPRTKKQGSLPQSRRLAALHEGLRILGLHHDDPHEQSCLRLFHRHLSPDYQALQSCHFLLDGSLAVCLRKHH